MNKLNILHDKILEYKRDPQFGCCGWVIVTGNFVTEMQTMDWVSKLMEGHKSKLGDRVKVFDGEIERI